jgi:hypothetical protein
VVKKIEQESGCKYGMKGRSIEGKQICWLPPGILSQSRSKCSKYVLLSKGLDAPKGRVDIDKCTTTQEKPVGVERANYI